MKITDIFHTVKDDLKTAYTLFNQNIDEQGLFSTLKDILTFLPIIIGLSILHNLASLEIEVHKDREKADYYLMIPGILFMVLIIGISAVVAPYLQNENEDYSSSCIGTYGSQYVNYSNECIPEAAAAKKLSRLFPESYEPVKKQELKHQTGLTEWSDGFFDVKQKAEEMGLIYCYTKNTGFLSSQHYCKQGEVVS